MHVARRAVVAFFFSSRRRHTRFDCDWSSDVCSSDLVRGLAVSALVLLVAFAFGAHMRSGVGGVLVLVLVAALWGVAYAGIGILVALHKIGRASCRERV